MSRPEEALHQIAVERRLLEEVCELVRACQGPPSVAALDVVLSGQRRAVPACSPSPLPRPRAPQRWRPPSSSGAGGGEPVRRAGAAERPTAAG